MRAASSPLAREHPSHPPQGLLHGSATASTGNLPSGLTSFLGRRAEVGEVAQVLQGSRLVTLTGSPGIGKSRLGLEVIRRIAGDELGAGWLVELAPVRHGGLVPAALAAALSVQEASGERLTDTIVTRVGARRALVMLDNCEHLVGACAEVAGALLRGCPNLRILATSREPLSIAGERVWQVPPLSVPGPDEPPVPEELMVYDAVSLFVERASAVQPSFFLHPGVASAVSEIASRLDGIPLAIELAAARVATRTPDEIARRLDDRFTLLVSGGRDHVTRHATLQSAIDWSHESLSAPERALLRRLAVFVGGFCPRAAEAVCAGGEVQSADVPDLLGRLMSRSLLVCDAGPDQARFRLLETIRAYAGDRLEEAGESAGSRAAHARFYMALAERAEVELAGPRQEHWFARLEAERANLRAAIEWSLGCGQSEWALRLAGSLVLFWRVRCHFSEGRDLLEAGVAAANGGAPALRARALWGSGFLAHMIGDDDAAVRRLEECLALFQQPDDVRGRARALLVLGNCRQFRSDARAVPLLEESARLAREAGDSWCLAHALALTGFEYASLNQMPSARPFFEEGLRVARSAGDAQGLRFGLLGLGRVALVQGEYGAAEALFEEAMALARRLGEEYIETTALTFLGELALGRGDHERARALHDEALARLGDAGPPGASLDLPLLSARIHHAEGDLRGARCGFEAVIARTEKDRTSIPALQGLGELAAEEGEPAEAIAVLQSAYELARGIGDARAMAQAVHALGGLARAAGDGGTAAGLHREALQLQRGIGDAPGIAASLDAVAGLAAAAGRLEHAARLLGAAQALRETEGHFEASPESSRRQADMAVVRQGLSAAQLEAALAEGAGWSIEEAVAQACKRTGRGGRPASGWLSLTERERHVSALVAEGLTNLQIAERLFIAPATVKNHLSHIYSKLGVGRRHELAATTWRRRNGHTPATPGRVDK